MLWLSAGAALPPGVSTSIPEAGRLPPLEHSTVSLCSILEGNHVLSGKGSGAASSPLNSQMLHLKRGMAAGFFNQLVISVFKFVMGSFHSWSLGIFQTHFRGVYSHPFCIVLGA